MKTVIKNGIRYETTDDGIITAIYDDCPEIIILGETNIKDVKKIKE